MTTGCNSGATSSPSKPASSPPQGNKPPLPVTVTFKPVKDRDYLKAIYQNESNEAFRAEVTLQQTVGQTQNFILTIGPREIQIDGEPTGLHYYSGDQVTINEANHAPLTIVVKQPTE